REVVLDHEPLSVALDPAHHADADAGDVAVARSAVRALLGHRAPGLDGAVAPDHVVVADVRPPIPLGVPAPDLLGTDVHVRRRGGTVDDDLGDLAHGSNPVGDDHGGRVVFVVSGPHRGLHASCIDELVTGVTA